MKALLKLCTVLTVLLVLGADYVTGAAGKSGVTAPSRNPRDFSAIDDDGTDSSYETSEDVQTTVYEQRDRKPVVNAPRVRNTAAANDKPRAPTVTRGWTRPAPNSEQAEDDGERLPDNIRDAAKGLLGRVKRTAGRRCVDALNGTAGTLRFGGGLASNLAYLVRKQANNSRTVANRAFETANELGDAVTQGAVKTMQAGGELCREGSCVAGGVLDAAKGAAVKLTRMGGTAATVPLAVGGDVLDASRRVISLPRAASQRFTSTFNDRLLPKLGLGNGDEDEAPKKRKPGGKR